MTYITAEQFYQCWVEEHADSDVTIEEKWDDLDAPDRRGWLAIAELVAATHGGQAPNHELIEPRFRETLERYAGPGRYRPGDFMLAVLSGDLFGALLRADSKAVNNLPHIASYIYNEMPMHCWGSPNRVREWLERSEE